MKRILSTILLVALAGSVFASTPAPSPFDPTAARKSLSNVVPATGRAALDVYSKEETDSLASQSTLQIPNNASFTFDGLSGEVTYEDFNELAEAPAYEEGRIFWDKDNGTLGMYSDVDGNPATTPILRIGQEHWIRVKNAGVATLTNGTVICLTSPLTGSDPIALIADASSEEASRVVGVVTADIPPDGTGYATALGLVRHLNTEGLTEGSKVFLSATTPGSFTDTVPAAPNSSIIVGYVVKAHATAGSIYVRIWLNGAIERANFSSEAYFDANVRVDADVLLESNGDTSRIYKTANAGNYDKPISIYAGGSDFTNAENGGQISLYGKDDEEPTLSGNVDIIAGADATGTGDVRILTGDTSTERIVIDGADGDINLKSTVKLGGHIVATGGTIRKFYGETIDDELMFKSGPLTGTGSYILMEAPAVTFSADTQRGSRFQWYGDDTNPSSALMYLFGDETISSYTLQLNGDAYFTQGLKIGGDISCSGTLYLDESPLIGGDDVLALKAEIPNNASFTFDGLSDSPAYTGHAGEVLALDGAGTSLEWRAAPLGVMASAETTSYTLTANTAYTVTALTGRQRIMVQNLSTYENIWVAPGSTNATISASICIGPLAAFTDDYDDTIDFAIIASTAQPIAILQEGE